MPIEKRRSERSFGGSFSSLGFGSIFGFDDELDAEGPTLSEYQQQSLSVFESEHMWAHFKAQLEENNIHTTAGVRAMLPEFVNNRVVDGSVQSSSEHQESTLSRSLSSTGTSILSEREGSFKRRNGRKIYPAAMRRQESFGKNLAKYGDMLRRSDSSFTSDHGIDSYQQAIRGDTDNVISLYNKAEIESDANLLRSVSKRLSQMTTLNSDRRMSRSNSVFSVSASSLDKDYDNYAINNVSVAQIPLGQSVIDNDNQSSRPKFRRPSLATEDEDNPDQVVDQIPQVAYNYSRRLSQSSQELIDYFGEVVGLPDDEEDILEECPRTDTFCPIVYQPKRADKPAQVESENGPSLDKSKAATLPTTTYEVDTFRPKSFTYEPKRNNCVTSSVQVLTDPDFIDNVVSVPYYCQRKSEEVVSSFNTSDTLLVEWGESESQYVCSDDESHSDADSERAVIIGRDEDICVNREGGVHEDSKDDQRPSPARLRIMTRMMASLLSEKVEIDE